MKNATFASFTELLGEIGRALAQALRQGSRTIATMAWPQLLVTCVALALALTILPLALCLFIVFMAIKLVVAAIVINTRRRKE
jgi:hypothetical protein